MKHHLLYGYYVHIANVGMEAETTFLLWWDVVCRRAEGSSTGASDPFGHDIFSVRAKARSRYSYIRLQKFILFLWQETGFYFALQRYQDKTSCDDNAIWLLS